MKNIIYFILGLTILLSCNQQDNRKNQSSDKKEQLVVISTPLGDMKFKLHDETPNHKAKFIELIKAKYFESFTLNRVIQNFVIQGGCPDSVHYFSQSPYLLKPEFNKQLTHKYGALGIGRDNNPDKESNVCQFYIVNNEKGLHRLDGEYMIIGQIVEGLDVLEKLEHVQTDTNDMPIQDIPLKVTLVDQKTK